MAGLICGSFYLSFMIDVYDIADIGKVWILRFGGRRLALWWKELLRL
jgi:hypothetical protein